MMWFRSAPLLCISSALTLFQFANAAKGVQDTNHVNLGKNTVSFGLHDNNAPEAMMDAPRRVSVYSSGRNDAQLNRAHRTPGKVLKTADRKEGNKHNNDHDDNDEHKKELQEEHQDGKRHQVQQKRPSRKNLDFPMPPKDAEGVVDLDARIAELKHWTVDPKNPSRPGWARRSPGSEDSHGYKPVRHDVAHLHQDPCTIASKAVGPVSYDMIKACLDADFAFPEYLRHDTVETIKSLISSFYVFEDLAAHPPKVEGLTFRSVDLVREVDQLLGQSRVVVTTTHEDSEHYNLDDDDDDDDDDNEDKDDHEGKERGQAKGGDDEDQEGQEEQEDEGKSGVDTSVLATPRPPRMTHREFHDGLSQILSKARDGHLSYDADCFRAFRFQHGFFMNHVVRDAKTVLKVHSVAPYFQAVNGVEEEILNCDVVTIAGKDASEYMQDWADKHVSMSKDANVRFNAALVTPQYRSGTVDFFIPGKFSERFMLPEEKSLAYQFRCPGSPTKGLLEVNVNWVGFYSHDQTKPFNDIQSYYDANCIKSLGEGYGGEDDKSRLEKGQDPEQQKIERLKSELRQLLSHRNVSKPLEATTALSTASSTIPSPVPTRSHGDPSPFETAPPQIPVKDVDEILTKLDLIASEQLPVVKFYDDYGGRLSELDTASSTQSFTELYKGLHGISAILLDDGKTGVITVRTESSTIRDQAYSRVHPAWAGSLMRAIEVLRPQAENLILDLSHNTGGYVCLGITMVQLFFPERPRLVTNVRLSPLGTQMMTAGALGIDHFISSYGDPVAAASQNGYFLHTISHPHRNFTFTDYMSDRCSIADRYILQVDPREESKRKRVSSSSSSAQGEQGSGDEEVYHPWDPENMVILTDGYCGSSCALISNMMHTKFGVKTVVVGGKSSSEKESMSYSTFPGLQVVDDLLLFGEMHDVRLRLMSKLQLERFERGGRFETGIAQAHLEVHRPSRVEKDDQDEDEDDYAYDYDGEKAAGPEQDQEQEEEEEEEEEPEAPEKNDPELFYPLTFAHKSRLRLTWRQIYHTGSESTTFKASENGTVTPSWKEVDQWHEYSFIPASVRIDYTDHNVHSIGAIWADTRDAVWGTLVDETDTK